MPLRKVPLINGEYYHVFNRGTNKMQIFNSARDYSHFIDTACYYKIANRPIRFSYWNPLKKLSSLSSVHVEVIAYCLMPNHFHFLLKQIGENGIQEFMRLIQNSYTKHFNTKYKREGALLQGRFKACHIEKTEVLLHISRYIHINPVAGFITKNLDEYEWSSYYEILKNKQKLADQKIILDQFQTVENYKKFVMDHTDYALKLAQIKHLLHEDTDV